jgi:surfactin synthase thioesterase subunit
VTTAIDLVGRWLPFPVAETGVRLFCLPHAGGSASVFRPWMGRLPGVAVCPLQPPGRETRRHDPPHPGMAELVDELAGVVLAGAGTTPYAVYGHSLGALVGFELVREVCRRGAPPPVHLVVSGCAAPQWPVEDDPTTGEEGLTDATIVALLRSLGGTPEEYLTDPRVLRIILPPLRADLAVRNSYTYAPAAPLDVPVTALAGTTDVRASVASMRAWQDQTIRRFRAHTVEGGHFAVLEQAEVTLAHLRGALDGARRVG